MKKLLLPALAALFILSGCAQTYVITLTDGERISTHGKPHLEHGYYHFKDASGHDAQVFTGRVREVAPASMATPDASSMFKPVSTK